ncbi:hypothetical protein [Nocardiopsis coralliicola]
MDSSSLALGVAALYASIGVATLAVDEPLPDPGDACSARCSADLRQYHDVENTAPEWLKQIGSLLAAATWPLAIVLWVRICPCVRQAHRRARRRARAARKAAKQDRSG